MPLPKASDMSAKLAQDQQAWKAAREGQLTQLRATLLAQRAQMLATIARNVKAALKLTTVKSAWPLIFSINERSEFGNGNDDWLEREKAKIEIEAWKTAAEAWVASQVGLGYKMEVISNFYSDGRINAKVQIRITW